MALKFPKWNPVQSAKLLGEFRKLPTQALLPLSSVAVPVSAPVVLEAQIARPTPPATAPFDWNGGLREGRPVRVVAEPGEGIASIAGRLADQAGFPNLDYPTRLALARRLGLSEPTVGQEISSDIASIAAALGRPIAPKQVQENSSIESSGPAAFVPEKTWVVSVGISHYRENIPRLRAPAKDASMLNNTLEQNRVGVGEFEGALLLNEHATRDSIETVLRQMAQKAGPNDRLIFTFSGHGVRQALLTWDSDAFGYEGLWASKLDEILSQSRAGQKIVVADACFAGSLYSPQAELRPQSSSTVYLVASGADEIALEESGTLNSGVFSHYFNEGLSGLADENGDQKVNVSEIFRYVFPRVFDHTKGQQKPQLRGNFHPELILSEWKD